MGYFNLIHKNYRQFCYFSALNRKAAEHASCSKFTKFTEVYKLGYELDCKFELFIPMKGSSRSKFIKFIKTYKLGCKLDDKLGDQLSLFIPMKGAYYSKFTKFSAKFIGVTAEKKS